MAGCRVRCFGGRHRKQGGTNTHLASPVERDASPWYNAPAKLSLRWAFGNGKGNKIEIRFVLFSICFFSHPSKEGTGRREATAAASNTLIVVLIWNNSHRLSVEILVLSRWDPVAEARNFRRWGLAAGNRSPRVVSLEVRPYLGLPSCNSLCFLSITNWVISATWSFSSWAQNQMNPGLCSEQWNCDPKEVPLS